MNKSSTQLSLGQVSTTIQITVPLHLLARKCKAAEMIESSFNGSLLVVDLALLP